MAPKRKSDIQVLDLTGDDDVAAHSAPDVKRSKHNEANTASLQSPLSSRDEDRDAWADGASTELVDLSQNVDTDSMQRLRIYGVINAKVVGVRFYQGMATAGEYVLVKREPGNPYDSNAIRIDNVKGQQIGHMPRTMAAKLAPLLDSGSISVEGSLAGRINAFDAPLDIKMFGTSDPVAASALKQQLQDAKLPVKEFIQEERDRKKRDREMQAAQAKERKKLLKDAASKGGTVKGDSSIQFEGGSGDWANITVPTEESSGPSMENIMDRTVSFDPRELGQIVDKYGAREDRLAALPKAEQPKNLSTQLLPYQQQGLAWMLDRENPKLPQKESDDATQLWRKNRNGAYTNIATSYTDKQPQLASGGILADDMGLGKTIQVISLIASDVSKAKQPTLIVCPLSVMSNWTGQAEFHMKKDKQLKSFIYHGENRKTCQKPTDFEAYDLVVTTYQTLALEYMPAGSKKNPKPVPRPSGLFSVDWRRVVLDEGHNIRNPKAKMAQAAYAVQGKSRWVLTGTPIVNNLRDLQSHLAFIRLSGGLEQADVFSGTLIRPLQQGREDARILLQALMSTICLRRMKDMKFIDLRLPKLSSHKYTFSFHPKEKETYDAFAQEAKGLLINYQSRKNAKGETTYSHLLEVLLRMRQVCNHWKLCADRATNLMTLLESQKKADTGNPEHVKSLQGLLQLAIDSQEECPVCMETLHNPAITPCAHAFGHECIERVIEVQHRCPMCRAELADVGELIHPAVEFGDSANQGDMQDFDTDKTSSKIKALMDLVKASHKKDSSTKTVIFSQWTSFLNIVGKHLQDEGFQYCRLDGTMNAGQRDDAMASLSNDADCRIMLASLGVCSVGLNLVAANQVVLADSWWAPAIEDQAVDRVYRLGQKRAVSVFRLVVEDSIEERVLDLQAQKRKLTMTAFGDTTMKRGNEKSARLADIEKLLS